jgi:hypothetical protein
MRTMAVRCAGTRTRRLQRWCLVGAFAALAVAPASAAATTQTFMTNGTFTVPEGVTSVSVDALGAKGGDNTANTLGKGGSGGQATGTVSVTPGETLSVTVGGEGGDANGSQGGSGGSGGGGDGGTAFNQGGAGGGGRSEVDRGSTQLLVAGGGGGAAIGSSSFSADGWAGGGLFGLPQGGRGRVLTGGTQTQGGLGGPGDLSAGSRGENGDKDQGGDGAGTEEDTAGGGGGGGGFYGGGGGGSSQDFSANSYEGGGGGSGHLDPSVTAGTMGTRVNAGPGTVTITYPDTVGTSTAVAGSGGRASGSGGGASGSGGAPPLSPPPLTVVPPEPSNAFSFARVRVGVHQLRLGFDYPGRGTLDVLVTTRRPGAASAAGLRPGPHRERVGRLHDSADGPETHTLRVPMTRRGQSILARRGKLPVRLSLVFTPDGGQSSRQARKFTVRPG